jgi:hypothetical protein
MAKTLRATMATYSPDQVFLFSTCISGAPPRRPGWMPARLDRAVPVAIHPIQ